MQTRRKFLGSVGAAAALGVAARPAFGGGVAETVTKNRDEIDEAARILLLKRRRRRLRLRREDAVLGGGVHALRQRPEIRPELYKDLLAYLKSQGADGVVVLGTTGEFPSFSFAERKKIAETALKTGMA